MFTQNKDFGWTKLNAKHLEDYLAAPPRCGIWLTSRFDLRQKKILECAGGSCRDSRYLYLLGLDAMGSDIDENVIDYIEKKFKDSGFKIQKEDARHLSFGDKSFDLVFHNGFLVYFDDENIKYLLVEQARVTRNFAVCLVHNAKNRGLMEHFARLSEQDDLYKIRFFHPDEIEKLVKESGVLYKKVTIEKFGGFFDRLYTLERRFPGTKKIIRWLVPRLYKFQPWSQVERVAVVIELR